MGAVHRSQCGCRYAGEEGEKLALKITGQITAAAPATNLPFVGWALRAANMAINVAAMAVTTGEIMSSPSTLSATVARSMDLEFTLKPDPEHGEAGNPDTAVSHHYQVTVQYQGGTNFVLKGKMPETTSSTPLKLTFADIPVGGKLQIMAGIYSESSWLCGKYQGEWLPAFPDDGLTSLRLSGNITEISSRSHRIRSTNISKKSFTTLRVKSTSGVRAICRRRQWRVSIVAAGATGCASRSA